MRKRNHLIVWMIQFVPIWINISLNEIKGEKLVFNFKTSLRFRKPSLLRNAETGHPPFKAIEVVESPVLL